MSAYVIFPSKVASHPLAKDPTANKQKYKLQRFITIELVKKGNGSNIGFYVTFIINK
jgi:hypothetical protein